MTFLESLTTGIRDTYCSALNASGDIFSLLGNAIALGNVGPFAVDPAEAIANGLGVASGLFCNTEPPVGPAPPFFGGQCPDLYDVSVTATTTTSQGPTLDVSYNSPGAIWMGPITSIEYVPRPQPGPMDLFINGQIAETYAPLSFNNEYLAQTISDVDFVRAGGPDDCGDLPVELPPVPPDVEDGIPTPITFVDENSNTVNLTPTLFFGNIVIDANLNANIPVRIEFSPNVSLNANLDISTGDVNFNIGGGSGSDETGCPTTPDDTIPDPPMDEETNFERIVAVRVVVSSINPDVPLTELFQTGGNPNAWFPDLGLVQFLCPSNAEGGNNAWTPPVRVQNQEQIIPCPVPWGAIRVSGTPRQGVTWQLISIRGSFPESSFP